MDPGARIAIAWRQVAQQLGVAVEQGEFTCNAGETHRYVHVRDFGGDRGTIVYPAECIPPKAHRFGVGPPFDDDGFFFAALTDDYARTDPALFEATLNEWGWRGAGKPPHWYTGRAWSAEAYE